MEHDEEFTEEQFLVLPGMDLAWLKESLGVFGVSQMFPDINFVRATAA